MGDWPERTSNGLLASILKKYASNRMWSIAENGQNLFSFLVHMLLQYDLSTSPIKCLFLNLLNVDLATELPLTKVEA